MCSPCLRYALVAVLLAIAPAVEAGELRVCADPNNLPFSKKDGTGFENRIAAVLADELGAKLTYTWFAQRRGFLRNTLNNGTCDVVMGYPPNYQLLRSTRPYYRSSYVFVRRAGEPEISSFDDPALRKLEIGVQLVGDDGTNTPPVQALAKRGIVRNVRGYMVYGDYRTSAPLSPIMTAVAKGDVDVAIVWGPTAGYFASRADVPLTLTPVLFDPEMLAQPMTFDIAVGVRKNDTELAGAIDAAIRRRRRDIDHILQAYGVPRTDQPTAVGMR
jgi:quinoprotein dehydrogenase-associated probable ABC transporter substrate-binding protein